MNELDFFNSRFPLCTITKTQNTRLMKIDGLPAFMYGKTSHSSPIAQNSDLYVTHGIQPLRNVMFGKRLLTFTCLEMPVLSIPVAENALENTTEDLTLCFGSIKHDDTHNMSVVIYKTFQLKRKDGTYTTNSKQDLLVNLFHANSKNERNRFVFHMQGGRDNALWVSNVLEVFSWKKGHLLQHTQFLNTEPVLPLFFEKTLDDLIIQLRDGNFNARDLRKIAEFMQRISALKAAPVCGNDGDEDSAHDRADHGQIGWEEDGAMFVLNNDVLPVAEQQQQPEVFFNDTGPLFNVFEEHHVDNAPLSICGKRDQENSDERDDDAKKQKCYVKWTCEMDQKLLQHYHALRSNPSVKPGKQFWQHLSDRMHANSARAVSERINRLLPSE